MFGASLYICHFGIVKLFLQRSAKNIYNTFVLYTAVMLYTCYLLDVPTVGRKSTGPQGAGILFDNGQHDTHILFYNVNYVQRTAKDLHYKFLYEIQHTYHSGRTIILQTI